MLPTRFAAAFTLIITAAAFAQPADPAPAPGGSAAGYDLRPIWREGQTSRYRIHQTELTRSTVPSLNQIVETVMEIEAEVTWQVTDADAGGGGTANLTMDSLKIKMTDPEGKVLNVTHTGGDAGTEPLQQWAAALAGTPVTVTIAANGDIEGVSGYEAIQQKAGAAGEGLDESYFREISMDLAVLFGGEQAMKPGATWKQQHDSSHRMGKIHHDATYRLQGVETIANIPIAFVNRTSRMAFEPDLADLPAEGPEVTVRMTTGDNKSTLMFDLTRHELTGATFEQTLELEVNMTFQGRTLTRQMREATSTQLLRIEEK